MPKYLLLKHYRGGPRPHRPLPRWTSGHPETSRRTWPSSSMSAAARAERRVRRRAGAHALADLGALRRTRRRARDHRRPAARDQRSGGGLVHDRRRVARARGRARRLCLLRAWPGRGAAVRMDRRAGSHVRGAFGPLTPHDTMDFATAESLHPHTHEEVNHATHRRRCTYSTIRSPRS